MAIGGVIEGLPPGIVIALEAIQEALNRRRPGYHAHTSTRREPDEVQWLSGLYEGCTTGSPIAFIIANTLQNPEDPNLYAQLWRPGHAQATYQKKYGHFDHRGGGRASGRLTAIMVVAGAIAEQLLREKGISTIAFLEQVGPHSIAPPVNFSREYRDSLYYPTLDPHIIPIWKKYLTQCMDKGDSCGGIITFMATGVPAGLGEPLSHKLSAQLAHAMLSIPAAKGFEYGSGFEAATMTGSTHNDAWVDAQHTRTNHSGGIQGGISNGMPIKGRVAFKPTSSIKKTQHTVTTQGESTTLTFPKEAQHDPCIALRAVHVVEAMLNLTLLDAYYCHQHWQHA